MSLCHEQAIPHILSYLFKQFYLMRKDVLGQEEGCEKEDMHRESRKIKGKILPRQYQVAKVNII